MSDSEVIGEFAVDDGLDNIHSIGQTVQHTVGTISWQQGNLYPSFMLLSATNDTFQNDSSLHNAVSTQLCFLPMQTHIYIW